MCQSKAKGGRRCASHLYPAFAKAFKAYEDTQDNLTSEVVSGLTLAAREYASTSFGYQKINLYLHDLYEQEASRRGIKDLDLIERLVLQQEIYATGLVALLNEALSKGYELRREYDDKEAEIKRLSTPSVANASPDLRRALEEGGLSLEVFFAAIKVAKALGSDIPAIEGSTLFEASYSKGRYEDYQEVSLGYYPSREQARMAIQQYLFDVSEDEEETPWGNIKDFDNPTDWETKRIDLFENHFEEVEAWFATDRFGSDGVDFDIKTHYVDTAPEVSWKK